MIDVGKKVRLLYDKCGEQGEIATVIGRAEGHYLCNGTYFQHVSFEGTGLVGKLNYPFEIVWDLDRTFTFARTFAGFPTGETYRINRTCDSWLELVDDDEETQEQTEELETTL